MATKTENKVENVNETQVENVNEHVNVEQLIGKDYDVIVKALLDSKDFTKHNNIAITNVTFAQDSVDETGRPDGRRVTFVLAKSIPTFIQPTDASVEVDEDGYARQLTNNLFTSATQVAAILKQQGEMTLASAVMKNPKNMLLVLEGARVSAVGRHYSKGEIEQNPFASKVNDYAVEHETIRYYIYDIALGKGAAKLKDLMFNHAAASMLEL